MLEILTANDFEVLARPWMPGSKVVTDFGFDPGKCVITVEDDTLSIDQPGRMGSFNAMPGFWRRVPNAKTP